MTNQILRHPRILAGTVALVLGALGVFVLLQSDEATGQAPASFSVFERARTPADALPKAVLANPLVADMVEVATSRRTIQSGDRTVYVTRAKDEHMCRILVVGAGPEPVVAVGCGPLAQFSARQAPGPMLYAETETSPQIAVGFLPDGFTAPTAGRATTSMEDNTYLLEIPASVTSVTARSPTGETVTYPAPRP